MPTTRLPRFAAERIRSGAADHEEDGVQALGKLGIDIPAEE